MKTPEQIRAAKTELAQAKAKAIEDFVRVWMAQNEATVEAHLTQGNESKWHLQSYRIFLERGGRYYSHEQCIALAQHFKSLGFACSESSGPDGCHLVITLPENKREIVESYSHCELDYDPNAC